MKRLTTQSVLDLDTDEECDRFYREVDYILTKLSADFYFTVYEFSYGRRVEHFNADYELFDDIDANVNMKDGCDYYVNDNCDLTIVAYDNKYRTKITIVPVITNADNSIETVKLFND